MKKPALISTDCVIQIPFHDVDPANVAWHGHYVKYFEVARCKLLDLIDYNYVQMGESGYFWPVIDMRVRYIAPSRFGQHIRVRAGILEWENRLRIAYTVTDADSGQKLTKGRTDQVAVTIDTGEMLLASPAVLYKKLGVEELS